MIQRVKKIAIVASSFPPLISGGISSAHYNLYKVLKGKGYSVKAFTFTDHLDPSENEEVVRKGTPPFLLKLVNTFVCIYYLCLRRFEPFEYGYQLPYILESAIGALRLNRPLREFAPDVVIIPDNGAPGFFIRASKGSKRILVSHHNPMRFINEPLFGHYSRKDAELALYLENRLLGKVDSVVCPSNYMKNVFNKTHFFKGPVYVIPNMVDDEMIASISVSGIRKEIGLSPDAIFVYIPSPGHNIKGARFVFEIIRRITASTNQEIGFFISGSIHDRVLKRELDFIPNNARIYCPGNLGYQQNISVVKSCSYAVSPTLAESFGMAILEANFCGLPVVSFNVGGTADIIRNGENGFLVPFLDIEKLIYHSIQFLDKEFLNEMRIKTLASVKERFSMHDIADQFIRNLIEG